MDNPSKQCVSFFIRSFADDRAKRPQSAADFFRQLEQALLE
jgi:hypothetical protein